MSAASSREYLPLLTHVYITLIETVLYNLVEAYNSDMKVFKEECASADDKYNLGAEWSMVYRRTIVAKNTAEYPSSALERPVSSPWQDINSFQENIFF